MRRPSLWERPFILRRCEVAVLFHLGRAAPDVAGESVGDASGGPRDHRAAQTPLDEPEKAARGSSSPKREAPGVAMSSLGQPSRRSLTRPRRNVRHKGMSLSWMTFTTAYLLPGTHSLTQCHTRNGSNETRHATRQITRSTARTQPIRTSYVYQSSRLPRATSSRGPAGGAGESVAGAAARARCRPSEGGGAKLASRGHVMGGCSTAADAADATAASGGGAA